MTKIENKVDAIDLALWKNSYFKKKNLYTMDDIVIWNWVQGFNPRRLYCCKIVSTFPIDETILQALTRHGYGSP